MHRTIKSHAETQGQEREDSTPAAHSPFTLPAAPPHGTLACAGCASGSARQRAAFAPACACSRSGCGGRGTPAGRNAVAG
eukprot:746559-Hanusia_phi.AAC.1